jgi:hypothetical protein
MNMRNLEMQDHSADANAGDASSAASVPSADGYSLPTTLEAVARYWDDCGYEGKVDYAARFGIWLIVSGNDDYAETAEGNDLRIIKAFLAGCGASASEPAQ